MASGSITRHVGSLECPNHRKVRNVRDFLSQHRNMFPITDLKDQTISIRIAGVDAPEVGQSNSHPDHILNKRRVRTLVEKRNHLRQKAMLG